MDERTIINSEIDFELFSLLFSQSNQPSTLRRHIESDDFELIQFWNSGSV